MQTMKSIAQGFLNLGLSVTPDNEEAIIYNCLYDSYSILCLECFNKSTFGSSVPFKIIYHRRTYMDVHVACIQYTCPVCKTTQLHFLALRNINIPQSYSQFFTTTPCVAYSHTLTYPLNTFKEMQKHLQIFITQQEMIDTPHPFYYNAIQSVIENFYIYLTYKYKPYNSRKLISKAKEVQRSDIAKFDEELKYNNEELYRISNNFQHLISVANQLDNPANTLVLDMLIANHLTS